MIDLTGLQSFAHQFHFLRPWWLLALLPFVWLYYLQYRSSARESGWQAKLPAHLRRALTVDGSGWKRRLPLHLLSLNTLLVCIVCAGPTWKQEPSPFNEDRTPLIILLDSSEAMLQTDVAPDRLTRAKQKILDLLQLRTGGQTALIAYAGSAHLAMPLTTDTAVFEPMLEALSPQLMPRAGKNSADALPLLEGLLGQSDVPGTVLLISNDITSASLARLGGFFADTPHQLLILAMGDRNGSSVLPLRLDRLGELADLASGQLRQVSIDDADIRWIKRRVEYHRALNLESDVPWQDMGYYLLFPILLLMLLWFRRGWVVQWVLFGLTIQGLMLHPVPALAQDAAPTSSAATAQASLTDRARQLWMDLWLTPDQQGQWYFNRGDYLDAARHFEDPLHKGVAFYYAAHYAEAHAIFMQSGDRIMAFNAANALARQREYLAARTLLRELVERYPDYGDARHNLALIEALIAEINRLSESQSKGPDATMEGSFELGDQPQTAEGAEEQVAEEKMIAERPSVEQLLADQALADKWLERVEVDPGAFLKSKFGIQYRQRMEQ
ncbi:transporter [Marinobacterium nitratireducens]|uniref:Transporter n=1 Tax=Marinobacterium nitratireducens TaxID=518897 RepID=A0A918DPW9_9GAMM|nr:VWA domain-containing protein [Marinobacterium nitratireducens]GGO78944.1 transporter [Marinobacterium nitratireducens]